MTHAPRLVRIALVGTLVLGCQPVGEIDGPGSSETEAESTTPAAEPVRRLLVKPKRRDGLGEALGGLSAQPSLPADALGARVVRKFDQLGGIEVREISAGETIEGALDRHRRSGLFEYVEPDLPITPAATPNDPRYGDGTQWSLHNTGLNGGTADADIDAPEAWDTRTDASTVVVMVADSGIRASHGDLVGNMWANPGEIQGNGIDDDGNGYVDDIRGINAIDRTGNTNDDYPVGHGTHVAGIIGAVGNNGVGISGVAWKAKLAACKIFDQYGSGVISSAVACLDYARAKGMKLVNMSFIGAYSYALRDAILAARASGIVVVAAAGNEGRNSESFLVYPGGYDVDNLVTVTASTRTDVLLSGSNYGATSVDLAAPGAEIYSTHNANNSAYQILSGTSMAAPHVTGALALMMAKSPTATYLQHINRLFASVDKPAGLAGLTRTGGRLNLQKALASTVTAPVNDGFAGRLVYSAGSCVADGTNVGASAETSEPVHAGVAGGKSVWWKWTAPAAGAVTISTERSTFDTLLAVYTGSSVGALAAVASNDNDGARTTSRVTFNAVAGTTYQIAVDGKAGATGAVSLQIIVGGTSGSHQIRDLGAEINSHGASVSNDVNGAGQVVGYFEQAGEAKRAFRWTESGGFVTLANVGGTHGEARAINGLGDAVGWSEDAGRMKHAVLWKRDGTTVDLGRLPGWNHCVALDVNDGLTVVGECFNGDEGINPRAFKWQSGAMSDLGAIDNGYSSARAITNGGRIVGKSSIVANRGSFRAVEWKNGAPVELMTVESEANDINETGGIVGGMVVNFEYHPFRVQGTTVTDLAPAGGVGIAQAINGKGEVLAFMNDNGGIYRNGTWTNLNTLTRWDSCGGSIFGAYGINDSGQIVGQMLRMNVPHAYFLKQPSQSFTPVADAYVRDGTTATTNYGTATTMEVKTGTTGYTRWAYVRFDTRALTTASNAKLRMWATATTTASSVVKAQVFSSTNTTWSESTITWNTKPAIGTTVHGQTTLVTSSTTGRWYEWDVTSFIKAEKAAGRHVVTLVLKNDVTAAPTFNFRSREASSEKPQLVIVP